MGRRGRRRESQRRAEGRVRGRVQSGRVQGGRVKGGRVQGGSQRRGAGAGRSGGGFDAGELAGYANRLGSQVGGSSGLRGGSGLGGAASGLAGAASGLAGGSLAHGFLDRDDEGSEEEFRAEVRERLDLIEQRLDRIEGQGPPQDEGESEGDQGGLAEPGGEPGT